MPHTANRNAASSGEAYSKIAGADVAENLENYMDKLDEQYTRADPLLGQLDNIILQIKDKMSKETPGTYTLTPDPNDPATVVAAAAPRAPAGD